MTIADDNASQTDAILAALSGDGDDEDAPEATPLPGDDAGDAAPGDTPASDDDEAGDDAPGDSPASDVPETFSAELKERFKALPADLQSTLAQWESERNRGVNLKLEEAATLRKTLETQQAETANQRQHLAQQLDLAINLAQTFNPIIAEGLKMTPADWAKLAKEDKATFIEKRATFDAEIAAVQQAMSARERLEAQNRSERVTSEMATLVKAVPELADPVKAKEFATGIDRMLRDSGFTPQEIAGVADHRMFLVARDAMRYRAGEAQRKAAAGKQTVAVPKVQKPGSGDTKADSAAVKAILNRAKGASSTAEQADALAALIE